MLLHYFCSLEIASTVFFLVSTVDGVETMAALNICKCKLTEFSDDQMTFMS